MVREYIFGDSKMEHFQDKTTFWRHLDHNDIVRRNRYRGRSKWIRDGKGNLTYLNPETDNYHSYHILW